MSYEKHSKFSQFFRGGALWSFGVDKNKLVRLEQKRSIIRLSSTKTDLAYWCCQTKKVAKLLFKQLKRTISTSGDQSLAATHTG